MRGRRLYRVRSTGHVRLCYHCLRGQSSVHLPASEATLKKTIAFISILLFLLAGIGRNPAEAAVAPPLSQDKGGEEKLARVNEHVITSRELDVYFKVFRLTDELREQGEKLPPLEREKLYAERRKRALGDLMERHLMLGAAKKEYLDSVGMQAVLDGLVAKRLRELKTKMGSLMALHRWLSEQGISLKEWENLTADSILVRQYAWDKIASRVHVSPAEVRRYYEDHKETFRQPRRVIYRVILTDPSGCETAEQERAKAERILQQILRGGDFAQMAEKHSLDRDRTEGGLREVEAPESAPDWVPPLCAGLEPGMVSDVQQTSAGYCIPKLARIVPSRVPPLEQMQGEIQRILTDRKKDRARKKLIRQLRNRAHVERWTGGPGFETTESAQ